MAEKVDPNVSSMTRMVKLYPVLACRNGIVPRSCPPSPGWVVKNPLAIEMLELHINRDQRRANKVKEREEETNPERKVA